MSMKPYVDEYQSVVQGMELRQKTLDEEFTSLIADIDKLSSKAHIEELTRITRTLLDTRTNLESVGVILQKIEKRIESIEKQVGIDDYDL